MLQTLAVKRSQIAELVDCLCCVCTDNSAVAAAIAAKLLFDLDRAIDLFSLGDAGDAVGVPELHAAAYGYVFQRERRARISPAPLPLAGAAGLLDTGVLVKALPTIKDALAEVEKLLRHAGHG